MDRDQKRSKIHLTTPFAVRTRVRPHSPELPPAAAAGLTAPGGPGRALRRTAGRWRWRKEIEKLRAAVRTLERRRNRPGRKTAGGSQAAAGAPVELIYARQRQQLAAILTELKSCRWWQTARQAWLIEKMEAVLRSEVRGQRAEVGGQRSEVRGQRAEVGGQRSEIRDQRSEIRGQTP